MRMDEMQWDAIGYIASQPTIHVSMSQKSDLNAFHITYCHIIHQSEKET